jgi:hypothetical protein
MDVKAWLHERLCLGSHEQLPELSDESLKILTKVAEATVEEEKREAWIVRCFSSFILHYHCVLLGDSEQRDD